MAGQGHPCLDLTANMTVDQLRPQMEGLGQTSKFITVWYSKYRNGNGTSFAKSLNDCKKMQKTNPHHNIK